MSTPAPIASVVESAPLPPQLSEEERAVYDRQLRVWGVEAQKRLRSSSVLIVGLGGLGAEVSKNLVLAGVGRLTIVDERSVTEEDMDASFLLDQSHLGKNRAESSLDQLRLLNPNVAIDALPRSLASILQGTEQEVANMVGSYSAILLIDQPLSLQLKLNTLLRENQMDRQAAAAAAGMAASSSMDVSVTPARSTSISTSASTTIAPPPVPVPPPTAFFCAGSFGFYAYFFEDLQTHTYTATKKATQIATTAVAATHSHQHQQTAGGAEEEGVKVTKVKVYNTSLASLHRITSSSSSSSTNTTPASNSNSTVDYYATSLKKFGRRRQEQSAAKVWIGIQALLRWQDQLIQQRSGSSSALTSSSSSLSSSFPEVGSDREADAQLQQLQSSLTSSSHSIPASIWSDPLLTDLRRLAGLELAHVVAIVGGILGQEVLKVLSGKDEPLANTFIYNATEGYGLIKEL